MLVSTQFSIKQEVRRGQQSLIVNAFNFKRHTVNWDLSECVCFTCAGRERVWRDPTAPQTCRRYTPSERELAEAPGLQCSGNNSTRVPEIVTDNKNKLKIIYIEHNLGIFVSWGCFALTILFFTSDVWSVWYWKVKKTKQVKTKSKVEVQM